VASFAGDIAGCAGRPGPAPSLLFSRVNGHGHGLCAGLDRFHFVEESDMKKLVALLMLLVMGGLAGCNTFEGLGKDVQRGGEKVEDSANRNR
jgi:predicted small secreted protein